MSLSPKREPKDCEPGKYKDGKVARMPTAAESWMNRRLVDAMGHLQIGGFYALPVGHSSKKGARDNCWTKLEILFSTLTGQ
jgi:hypothetical protein